MADAKKPPKTAAPPPFVPSPSSGHKLSYKQLRSLWIKAGGDHALASTMASIALAESGGDPNAHNGNASTGDDSYGLWQINYYGGLKASRTKAYGPTSKITDPLANARAAVAIAKGGAGLANWSTYKNGAYQAYYQPVTPQEKAGQSAALIAAEAKSQAYIGAQAAREQTRVSAHLSDPWVTVNRNKAGQVVSFGEAYGQNPPANVLTQGSGKNGIPLTRSTMNAIWSSTYQNIYEEYTGKVPSAQNMADVLEGGLSPWGLQDKLSQDTRTFVNSPIYKKMAPSINDYAKTVLGTAAPADIVRQAIAQGWDQSAIHDALTKASGYLKGPEYQTNFATMKDAYQQIYGAPDSNALQTIKEVAANGWTTQQFASYLRDQPQYTTSIEYQTNATNFLDAMGLFTGSRATLTPGAAVAAGGTAVSNAPNVPGVPKPLNPELPFTPTLPGTSKTILSPTSTPTPAPTTNAPPTTTPAPATTTNPALAAGREQRLGLGG